MNPPNIQSKPRRVGVLALRLLQKFAKIWKSNVRRALKMAQIGAASISTLHHHLPKLRKIELLIFRCTKFIFLMNIKVAGALCGVPVLQVGPQVEESQATIRATSFMDLNRFRFKPFASRWKLLLCCLHHSCLYIDFVYKLHAFRVEVHVRGITSPTVSYLLIYLVVYCFATAASLTWLFKSHEYALTLNTAGTLTKLFNSIRDRGSFKPRGTEDVNGFTHPYVIVVTNYLSGGCYFVALFICVLFWLRPNEDIFLTSVLFSRYRPYGLTLKIAIMLVEWFSLFMKMQFILPAALGLIFSGTTQAVWLKKVARLVAEEGGSVDESLHLFVLLQLFIKFVNSFAGDYFLPGATATIVGSTAFAIYIALTAYGKIPILIYLIYPTFATLFIFIIIVGYSTFSKLIIESGGLVKKMKGLVVDERIKRDGNGMEVVQFSPRGRGTRKSDRYLVLRKVTEGMRASGSQMGIFGFVEVETPHNLVQALFTFVLLLLSF